MKNVIRRWVVVSVLMLCVAALANSPGDSSATLASIRSHQAGIGFWWVGNDGWLIKSAGVLIGIDLDLEEQGKLHPPPLSAKDAAEVVDVVFVTHHHGDHCNLPTISTLSKSGRCVFVLPRTCVDRVAKSGIPEARRIVALPGHPFEIRGIRVEPIHAIHGNQDFTVLTREPDFVDSIAYSCGYVFDLGGKRILQPGDSVLTEEHLGLKGIDVLFVSPTVHNMYIDRSMILINRLQPAYIIPQHFETYRTTEDNAFWTRGYPDELKLSLSQDLQKRYHKLRQGEKFVIP
jgi:L-ascorbate metabolism protein UlaG (beta-lactamase superfamily)